MKRAVITQKGMERLGLPHDTVMIFDDFTNDGKPLPHNWYAVVKNGKLKDGTVIGERVHVALQNDNPSGENFLFIE